MMIISRHIETQLNYRTTVSLRSDFLHINGFPEVYHGGEISAAVVTPGWTWPDTQWKTAVKSPSFLNIGHKTVSFHGNFRGGISEDPELWVFGSSLGMKRTGAY